MSMLFVYFIAKASNIVTAFGWLIGLSIILLIVGTICTFAGNCSWDSSDSDIKDIAKDQELLSKLGKAFRRPGYVIFIISFIIYVFMPNTKQLAAIYLVPKIVNNEEIKGVASDSLNLMKVKIKQWLDETIKDEAQPNQNNQVNKQSNEKKTENKIDSVSKVAKDVTSTISQVNETVTNVKNEIDGILDRKVN